MEKLANVVIDKKVLKDGDNPCLLVEEDTVDGLQVIVLLLNHEFFRTFMEKLILKTMLRSLRRSATADVCCDEAMLTKLLTHSSGLDYHAEIFMAGDVG